MTGLLLEQVPIPGVPDVVRIGPSERRALVIDDPDQARRLADLVAGIEQPPAGTTVRIDGPARLVPPDGGLLPHLTVLGNIVHGHRATGRGLPRRTATEECHATARRCGLDDVLDRFPYEITPGRRRLAGVARALRAGPAVIVLEDAPGLPRWGALLEPDRNPELLSAALLLITYSTGRTEGFGSA